MGTKLNMKLLVSIVWTLVLAGSVHSLTSQERTALANLMHHWPSLTDPSVVTHPWNNSFDQACNYFSDEPVWDGWSGLFCNSHGSVAQLYVFDTKCYENMIHAHF